MEIFNYDNRTLKILNILEESFSVQEKYLIDVLKVSLKTIQNEIKDLNHMFQGVAYIKQDKLNYTLYIINIEEYIKIKSKIYEMYTNFDSSKVRLVYIFKKLIESKKSYLIDDLAFEMMVSRTTLNNDIKKLKSIIVDYDLSIIGRSNKGIKLQGTEKDIRLFILSNIYNYQYKENIFSVEDLQYIDQLLINYDIDFKIKSEFIKYLTVSIDRTANDFKLNLANEEYKELLDFYVSDFIDDIFSYIYKKYDIELSIDDKKFVTICFATMNVPTKINKNNISPYYYEKYSFLVQDIFTKIREEYGIDIDISEIMEEFIYHIYFLMQRQRYGIRYKNNMKEMIKEKYLMSYKIAQIASKVIEDKYGYIISEDEICYLSIYFETFISKINFEAENISVLVITNSGPAFRELIVRQIKSLFTRDILIDVATPYEEKDLDYYTLIISTIKMDFKTKTSVILQNEILDLDYLSKEINFLKYIGKMNMPLIRGMESILLSSISEETFFIADSTKSYTENLYDMIEILSNKSLVDDKFLDRIIERGKKSSMIFSKNIAFPHTFNYKFEDKLLIAIGISKDGFADNKDLKIIFLAAIPENSSNSMLLVKTYDELIDIMKDTKLLDEIVKVENYKDFINYFIKNTNLYR
ncbi:PRD domain-containing protein [Gemella sp. GH3]|uniref:BglG family transcription antiterminator n=1 Tax=unclassified Gemella TaxID=2624949 RepID=UPI0015CFE0FB|nr:MULTISPECIES: PTS sugar transporter subunit IIA [unclassified Gemella]MBF0713738.1 PRD domain-containing protein [Gemella sp. GH3.1]NYS50690.1 PRD domain-containing protein [Gemella sp. GH3]